MQLLDFVKNSLYGEKSNFRGQCAPEFLAVAQVLSQIQPKPMQGGGSVCVYFRGQPVVQVYAGEANPQQAWNSSNMALCYSTGKAVLATLTHVLVSQGALDYDTPVQHYWAAFGQNGKQSITLRHLLSHQSGLFDIRNTIQDAKEMLDWQHMLEVYAKATPRLPVGQVPAYHALSFGWLIGGLLEHATGQSLSQLLQQYLVEPLQLDGAYFGVPDSELARVAKPFPKETKLHSSPKPTQPKSIKTTGQRRPLTPLEKLIKLSGNNPYDAEDALVPRGMGWFDFFSTQGLQAIIPAANGVFTANSLAKMYAMLANNGVWQGQTLIRPEIMQQLTTIQTHQRDKVMPVPMLWRLGYHRVFTLGKRVPNGFGHIGYNGSGAWCDPSRELSFAYIHNFRSGSITGDYRLWRLTQTALQCADKVGVSCARPLKIGFN